MPLTTQQITLVQRSLPLISPMASSIGEKFYAILFQRHPELRILFQNNMKDQARKLMTILIHVMTHLDQFNTLEGDLHALAQRHIGYMVRAEHYTHVGEAFLETLAQELGERWTPELAQA